MVIEAVVDPNEPPMPPKVDAEAGAAFRRSAGARHAERGKIALTVASDIVREIV